MRWPLAHVAKVVGRRDDPRAEMRLPNSIRKHARRQWIISRNEPPGERDPPLLFRRIGRKRVSFRGLCQRCQTRGHHRLALSLGVASLENTLLPDRLLESAN